MCVIGGFLFGNFDALHLLFDDPHISEFGKTYGFPFTISRTGDFQQRWSFLAAAGNIFCFAFVLALIYRSLEGHDRRAKPDEELGKADANGPHRKRAWFQLHLSTCVVLMLAAGALVWANVAARVDVRDNEFAFYGLYEDWNPNGPPPKVPIEVRGWPWPYQDSEFQYVAEDSGGPDAPLAQFADVAKTPKPHRRGQLREDIWQHPEAWSKLHLAADLGVAFALLAVVAVLCETLIRRRERKRAGGSA